ncbi:MAG: hypothetical protein MUC38_14820 [Cyclobacteriaceae bacterium]|jgi:uncharacterized membrane protein|nr:hypothetical protein [Cyclobacteriaceae bacterium]
MKKLSNVGKWLFILPFAVFGLLHFGPLEFSLPFVPAWLPFRVFWIYFLGVCLMAFTVSAALGKWDRLASVLLAVLMMVFVAFVHVPRALQGDFMGIISSFRDVCMAGAALVYAGFVARDQRFVS